MMQIMSLFPLWLYFHFSMFAAEVGWESCEVAALRSTSSAMVAAAQAEDSRRKSARRPASHGSQTEVSEVSTSRRGHAERHGDGELRRYDGREDVRAAQEQLEPRSV